MNEIQAEKLILALVEIADNLSGIHEELKAIRKQGQKKDEEREG